MSKLDELVEQFPITGSCPDVHEGKRRIRAYIEERFGPLMRDMECVLGAWERIGHPVDDMGLPASLARAKEE